MPDPDCEAIRKLNDEFRTTGAGGRIMVTPGIAAMLLPEQLAILQLVQSFNAFAADIHRSADEKKKTRSPPQQTGSIKLRLEILRTFMEYSFPKFRSQSLSAQHEHRVVVNLLQLDAAGYRVGSVPFKPHKLIDAEPAEHSHHDRILESIKGA